MFYAVTMMAIGTMGLVTAGFAPIWRPVPASLPARQVLAYACAIVVLLCGIGVLWSRTTKPAATTLFAWLLAWLVLFRLSRLFVAPTSQETWSGIAEMGTVVAGAMVLVKGARPARIMYGVASIIFGLAHFRYLGATASLVPAWIPLHMAWAVFTGCAFIGAGLAILAGVQAALAAALSALQLGLFTLLVWVPFVIRGPSADEWSEFVVSWAVTAGAWMVADSYRVSARKSA